MKVLSDDLHVWVEEGDEPAKVTMQESVDGKGRYLAIRLKVGDVNVVVNGDFGEMMAWLAGTMQNVAEAVNDDARRTIAQAIGDADEDAYRRAEDAIEQGLAS